MLYQNGKVQAVILGNDSSSKTEEIYSTEEQVIGKWIDGKPLYRVVICTKTPSVERTDTNVAQISADCLVKNLSGLIELKSNQVIPINEARSEELYVETWYTRGLIEMRIAGTGRLGKDCWIILEYTKTTDQATYTTLTSEISKNEAADSSASIGSSSLF